MSSLHKLGCLTFAAIACVMSPAAAQTKGSKAADTAQDRPMATNVIQLCRTKEVEMVQMANFVQIQLREIMSAKDAKKQAELGAQYQTTKNILQDLENSWQRLSCTMILYGASKDFVGR